MQNKGFVKLIAVLLTLICLFYLSFSVVTNHYEKKAEAMGENGAAYLDSMRNENVWLGYTLKRCEELQIGLGLDLKGGMNVILEVSVPDVVKALADHKSDEAFNKAVAEAARKQITSQADFITLFVEEYRKLAPESSLAELFATQQLKDKVNTRSTDDEVIKVLRAEVKAAIDNSFNVLRTRIDRFGVAQPNIQNLEGSMGRIMVELPGIKEPERVRALLQGSANLEFWETYKASEITSYLNAADNKLRTLLADKAALEGEATETTEEVKAEATDSVDVAAALTGETANAQSTQNLEQLKKEHPLAAILQFNTYDSPVAGYAHYKDTAEVNRLLAMPEVKNMLPRDLRLYWGVKAADFDKTGQIFELYAIKSTERNGKAPLEGDVITDARDEFDNFGKPSVSMSMNTDGARRWATLTKNNIGKAIAIVLDGYVYSAPNVNGEITGGNVYWNQSMLWYRNREKGWSDMEWMIRDWVNWTWLSGDHICEQHVHNIDVFLWMSGLKVKSATSFGSRQRRITGDQYDNFSTDFICENGVHFHSMCRQINGCSNAVGEEVFGTKGSWNSFDHEIKDLQGNVIWKYDKEAEEAAFKQHNPYVLEHVDAFNQIRRGTSIDEATACAVSCLAGVMGRESAYTGKSVTWEEMSKSDLDYMPAKLEIGPMDMSQYTVRVPGNDKK